MKCIVAVDKNWAIGFQGDLLAHMKEDMKFFRRTTKDKVVVMGRKTLDSFPGGNPLKNRVNIVVSGNPSFSREGCIVVHSVEELLTETKKYPEQDVYCIGGGHMYKELLPYCDTAYVTRVHRAFDNADTWFPNLNLDPSWVLSEMGETFEEDGLAYTFATYRRSS